MAFLAYGTRLLQNTALQWEPGEFTNLALSDPPGPPDPVTWDAASRSDAARLTLSNGSMTVAASSSSGSDLTLRATRGYSGGKKYFEMLLDGPGPPTTIGVGVGIANSTYSITNYLGFDANAISFFHGDGVYTNNASVLAFATFVTAGQRICISVDLDAKLIWFRINNGNWNNNASANPATGTLGLAYTSAGAMYPSADLFNSADQITAKFLAADFAQTPPSGFSAWDAGAAADTTGTLAVTEASVGQGYGLLLGLTQDAGGGDVAALSGIVGAVIGTVAATEAGDTAAFTGSDTAVLAATEALDTSSITGTWAFGTLAATEASDTSNITGSDTAMLAATDSVDTALITGSDTALLAATEAGDTPAFTGTVAYLGTLAAVETGDGAAFTGSDSAVLAATDAPDISSITGTVAYLGTLAATEGADTVSITGSDTASLAYTEPADIASFTGTGSAASDGTLAYVENPDNAAFTGSNSAVLAATDVADTAAFSGSNSAVLAATEAADVPAFTGSDTALLAVTDNHDTAAFSGTVAYLGALATTEAPDTASITGSDTAILAATDAPDVAAITGTWAFGTLGATDGSDTASIIGAETGILDVTEPADIASITGSNSAILLASEAADVSAITGTVPYIGSLAATEAADVSSITGSVPYEGTLAASDAPDFANFSGLVTYLATLAVTEEPDTANFIGAITGTLAIVQNPDNASITGFVSTGVVLAAIEPPDIAFFTDAYEAIFGAVFVTEAKDVAAVSSSIAGPLAATEAKDIAALTGSSLLHDVLHAIENGDICLIQGDVAIFGPNRVRIATKLPAVKRTVRVIMADPPQTLMAVVDIPMERGNNVPIEWALMNDDNSIFDLTDSEFFLTITWTGGQIVKQTGVDSNFVKSVQLGTVTYIPNLPESRMIRPGRIARYELERRQGTAQRVLMAGDMLGVGGDNVD